MRTGRRSMWLSGGMAALAAWMWQAALQGEDDVLVAAPQAIRYTALRQGEQAVLETVLAAEEEPDAKAEKPDEYRLGVQIAVLPELAKQQLRIDHGLAVEDVSKDSPAAKAEIKKYDILIQAGETPLKDPADLAKSVQASQGKEIAIQLRRGGEARTIHVTPDKRPKSERLELYAVRPELQVEIKRLEEALESLKTKAGKDGLGLWFARPGVIAPRIDARGATIVKDLKGEFPKDLSVQINKQGGEPTKIHVRRGDKEWDVTEDKLSELPDDVRPHVQKLLGRMLAPGMAAAAARTLRISPEGKVEGELRILPIAPAAPQPPHPPAPPAAPRGATIPAPPARVFSNRFEIDGRADAKLDAIIKKLDALETGTLQRLDAEVKKLRTEIDELQSQSAGGAGKRKRD